MTDLPTDVEVAEEYRSSLADLTMNSKPMITMLTMLAEENRSHAAVIVGVIEKHIQQVRESRHLDFCFSILISVSESKTKRAALGYTGYNVICGGKHSILGNI